MLTLQTDTTVADTTAVVADSVAMPVPGEELGGIVLTDPAARFRQEESVTEIMNHVPGSASTGVDAVGMSWIYLALAALFCAVGIKFKGSSRYLKAMFSDLTDTRLRNNAFDDTVKETSLLVLLNAMWAVNAGILLWALVVKTIPTGVANSFGIPDMPAGGIGICIGIAALYVVGMLLAYWIVGNVFSDRRQTQVWVKGAAASSALEALALFPVSLLTLVYPAWNTTLLVIGAGVIIMGKIMFLYKGFRIFFSEISSWLLFLYYLCSLEIVPLILTYVGAVAACGAWLS